MGHTEQWRITMLGDGGVGKTALAVQASASVSGCALSNEFAETYDPTIEDAFRHSVIVDDEMTYLEIVDTAGQEEYATLRDQWIREGEGFILVYSIASRRSYDRIKTFQDSIMRVKRGARPVFMLVGNKCDKAAEREVSKEEALSLSRVWGCPFMETSAKTAHNVERMFSDTIRTLRQARDGDNYNRPRTAAGAGGGGGGGAPERRKRR
ncbi:Ras GTPase ras2, partial [Ceratobasidium sp. 423]